MVTQKSRSTPESMELEKLRARLAEAEEVLHAIRSGGVDAVVVTGVQGDQVFTLDSADRPYRHLIETMSEAALTLSADGTILFANRRFAELVAQPLDQLVGSKLRTHLLPSGVTALAALLEQVQATTPTRIESSVRAGGGRVVPVLLSAARLDGDSPVATISVVLTDLRDRKQHEQAAADERLSRLILDQSTEALVVCDERGMVIRANEAAVPFGDGNSIGRLFSDAFPLRAMGGDSFDLTPVLRGERLVNVETVLDRGGMVLELTVNAGPLRLGDQILGCVVSLTDISERRRREAAVRLQAAALNAAAEAIVITDMSGVIEWANAGCTRVTGYSADEAIGQRPTLFKSGIHDRAFYEKMWKTILGGDVWRGELTNRRKDGSLYAEEMSITPLRNDGGAIEHFIAIKRDLTEQHKLSAQLLQSQKMETVGQLAGGIAHDFNNLLLVISATADLAVPGLNENDPLRSDLLEICSAGERAAALTRQLLAFSRTQIQRLEAMDLNALVVRLQSVLARVIGRHIVLSVIPAGSASSIHADPVQIEQVLMNLAVNARDAMEDGGSLTMTVRNVATPPELAPASESGRWVTLTVSDTGVGMLEETLARIFDPFFTTKDPGKGTGLGLSTVYGIVKQCGGDIRVSSVVGTGTTFVISLPAISGTAVESAPVPKSAGLATGVETVLLVDDEPAVRAIAQRMLERAGYTVLSAATGPEARTVLEQHGGLVSLLLTDLIMPRMSGWQLAEQLLSIRPALKVLFMSGYTGDAVLPSQKFPGAINFIAKPFVGPTLARKVRDVLDA